MADWEMRSSGPDGEGPYSIERGSGATLEVLVDNLDYARAERIEARISELTRERDEARQQAAAEFRRAEARVEAAEATIARVRSEVEQLHGFVGVDTTPLSAAYQQRLRERVEQLRSLLDQPIGDSGEQK